MAAAHHYDLETKKVNAVLHKSSILFKFAFSFWKVMVTIFLMGIMRMKNI